MDPSTEAPATEPRRLGSYSTARVRAGRIERLEQHVARLRRDASRIGLPLPPAPATERAVVARASEAFGLGDGIIRVEWSGPPGHAPELRTLPRAFVPHGETWRAASARTPHPGPEQRANTKYVDVPAYDRARAEAAESESDEVLLFDARGFLVEGSRSNCLVVTSEGHLVTPALALGGVEGLGLATVRHGRTIGEARLTRADLQEAREVAIVNAVRGVVPIVEIDGVPVGSGEAGAESLRLAAAFATS